MDRLTQEFLAESFEGLDRMDRCLTALEAAPSDAGLLGELFRVLHTLKGSTGFLGLERLERLAHAGEHVMGSLRSGRIRAGAEVISGLLQATEAMRLIARRIAETGQEGQAPDAGEDGLLARLAGLEAPGADLGVDLGADLAGSGPGGLGLGISGPGVLEPGVLEPGISGPGSLAEDAPVAPATGFPVPGAHAAGARLRLEGAKTLRVELDVLNRMMNLVGELVLTRNQIVRTGLEPATFPALALRLDQVTSELRANVMEARMQPLGQMFEKFPLLVRRLALQCGKQVRLEVSGQETGLDKGLLEAIRDPLGHALRNAIDHGIESPLARAAAGKPPMGTVAIRAFQQNGLVVIEVEDDGGGIAREGVLAKALERGLVTAEQARGMGERERLELVFAAGLSTASGVTLLSGRGVGMDVVKSNIERVGGSVEIESEEGRGTLLRMRVPLTLAIVPAFVVASGAQSFCLPESALLEALHLPWPAAVPVTVPVAAPAALPDVFALRGVTLPLLWLDDVLGLAEDERERQAHGFYVAILEASGVTFGLAVTRLEDPEEIVVKPLPSGLGASGVFAGVTVLGNGQVALIVDAAALAARAAARGLGRSRAETWSSRPFGLPGLPRARWTATDQQRPAGAGGGWLPGEGAAGHGYAGSLLAGLGAGLDAELDSGLGSSSDTGLDTRLDDRARAAAYWQVA